MKKKRRPRGTGTLQNTVSSSSYFPLRASLPPFLPSFPRSSLLPPKTSFPFVSFREENEEEGRGEASGRTWKRFLNGPTPPPFLAPCWNRCWGDARSGGARYLLAKAARERRGEGGKGRGWDEDDAYAIIHATRGIVGAREQSRQLVNY